MICVFVGNCGGLCSVPIGKEAKGMATWQARVIEDSKVSGYQRSQGNAGSGISCI